MYDFSKVLLTLWRCSLIAPVVRQKSTTGGGLGQEDRKYVFCTMWYAANLGALCACLGMGLWAVIDDLRAAKVGQSLRMQNTSAAIVTVLQVTLMSMVCAMAVTRSAGRHGALLEIERQLRHADAVLGVRAGEPVTRFAYALLAFHAVLFAVDGCLWHALSPSSWMYYVCYAFLFIELGVMLMYAQIAWSIGHRFGHINAEIETRFAAAAIGQHGCKNLADDVASATLHGHGGGRHARVLRGFAGGPSVAVSSAVAHAVNRDLRNTSTKTISIAKLQELHWSLCNSIEMVNNEFGWQLFLELFLNCVQLIVTPYFMIVDLFYPVVYGSTDIKFILIQVVWVLTHLINLLLVVLPTSYATQKGEKTAVIICKYLTIDIQPDDMKQIIGTAITYLVILIQFQNTD